MGYLDYLVLVPNVARFLRVLVKELFSELSGRGLRQWWEVLSLY